MTASACIVLTLGKTLSTANLTLDGNGRQIEGAATITLDNRWPRMRLGCIVLTLATWVRITDLALADDPTPRDFDDYWSILLAMRLNPPPRARSGRIKQPMAPKYGKQARGPLSASSP